MSDASGTGESKRSRILAIVSLIPAGRVATYGQIAELAGLPAHARLVGYALHGCRDTVPWHRVINAAGRISLPADTTSALTQRRRLESEGIIFIGSRVDLDRFRWDAETHPIKPNDG